jgi:hypothetical protein
MHPRKLLDWRKALIYTHRWAGIVLTLVFVIWFVSGVAGLDSPSRVRIAMYRGRPVYRLQSGAGSEWSSLTPVCHCGR